MCDICNAEDREIKEFELTNTESLILNLIVKGKKDTEIAQVVSLEEEKVEEIIKTIQERFNIKRRIDLATYAVKNRLTD